jgi:hypothetical protein
MTCETSPVSPSLSPIHVRCQLLVKLPVWGWRTCGVSSRRVVRMLAELLEPSYAPAVIAGLLAQTSCRRINSTWPGRAEKCALSCRVVSTGQRPDRSRSSSRFEIRWDWIGDEMHDPCRFAPPWQPAPTCPRQSLPRLFRLSPSLPSPNLRFFPPRRFPRHVPRKSCSDVGFTTADRRADGLLEWWTAG